jgi:hypothetical protein
MVPFEFAIFLWAVPMLLFLGFIFKHFAVDFLLQNRFPWMWMNKGKFLHPGGLVHAGSHVVVTGLMFWWTGAQVAEAFPYLAPAFAWGALTVKLLILEFVSHYLMDYAKIKIGEQTGWKPHTSPYYWDLLGFDQLVHYLTYWVMIWAWSVSFLKVVTG